MKRNLTWKFRITPEKTPQGEQARTWVDLLLFDQLVREILKQHSPKFDHWRIHRRWAGGEHEFEFWCYGEDCLQEGTLRNTLDSRIVGDTTLRELQSKGYVVDPVDSPPQHAANTANELLPVGDDHWDDKMQRCYPKFITRLSETLRDVIDEVKGELTKHTGDEAPRLCDGKQLAELDQYYRNVEEEIRRVWFNDAAHAYFHMFHMAFGFPHFRASLEIVGFPGYHPVQIGNRAGKSRIVPVGQFVLGDIR
jgi:hypothetical protein